MSDFDAIVIGSGMTGGIVAKELCERGLKTLVIERGRQIDHPGKEYTDQLDPWDQTFHGRIPQPFLDANPHLKPWQLDPDNLDWFVSNAEQAYETGQDTSFAWIRSYNLGGRSLLWARKSFRMSESDLASNRRDGHGVPWPIGYRDLAPWYDRIEEFIGVSGDRDGIETLPDGNFQPGFELNCAEKAFKQTVESKFPGRRVIVSRVANLTRPTEAQTALGRGQCQARNLCAKGCSYGAYFSSVSSSLPAARQTGNLTVITDAIAVKLVHDETGRKVVSVEVVDAVTRARTSFSARIFFVNASAVGSAQLLLASASDQHPEGLANRSGAVGRYLNDHVSGVRVTAIVPGLLDRYYSGRRPTGFYIPRYQNLGSAEDGFTRGFGFQGSARRLDWERGKNQAGIGSGFARELRQPGPWMLELSLFGEAIPRWDNRMVLHPTKKDKWDVPLVVFSANFGAQEQAMRERALADGLAMVRAAGCTDIRSTNSAEPVGYRIHEHGTIVMGDDPGKSVLNAFNHAHEVDNLYVSDGACMPSAACQNPSLTYMALSARAAHHAADRLAAGQI
jgi:choline dehydrogenase-like flavoprotein